MAQEKLTPQGSDDNFIWNLAKYGLLPIVAGLVAYTIYQKITGLEAENQTLKQENEKLSKILELQTQQQQIKNQFDENQLSTLRQENLSLKSDNAALTQNLPKSAALKSQNIMLHTKLTEQAAEMKNLQATNAQLLEQLKNDQENIETQISDQIKKQTEGHQKQIDSLTETSKNLSEQLDLLEQKNSSLISTNSTNQDQIENLQTTNAQLLEQLKTQKAITEAKEQQISTFTQTIKTLQEANTELKQKLQAQPILQPEKPARTQAPASPRKIVLTHQQSNVKTLSQIGNFSHGSTISAQQHNAKPVSQTQNKKDGIITQLIAIFNNENTLSHEKDFANYLIFLLALHKRDKPIKQIMAETKEFLANELNIRENDLSEKFAAIAPIINSEKDIEDILIENCMPNNKYHSLSENELENYFRNFKNGSNNFPKNLKACNVFGVLLGSCRNAPYGKSEQNPNGISYTKENYTNQLKEILLKSMSNLSKPICSK